MQPSVPHSSSVVAVLGSLADIAALDQLPDVAFPAWSVPIQTNFR